MNRGGVPGHTSALQASKRQLDNYQKLKQDSAEKVCDVCLQPIEEALYAQNAARLQDQVAQSQARQMEAAEEAATAKVIPPPPPTCLQDQVA